MDRSYPYSRRLVSRARLRKRMAAVAATGLAGAAALFMLAWEPATLPATPPAPEASAPALAGSALDVQPRGPRRIYPYSVVPGGVSGQAELARVIRTDRVVATHYASFDVHKARPVVVDKPRAVHVSYRKGDKVYWTARKVMLAEGETLLSDGRNEMRARCANRISDVAQYPVEAHQPAMDELDNPVELDEVQFALGPDGLPVSIDPFTGIPRHAGQRFPARGSSAGASGGAPGNVPDTLLASSAYSPGTATGTLITTMGLSNSSGSTGGRPRPVDGTPVSAPDSATGTAGSGGSSSGSPAPGGPSDPLPVPETGKPPPSPLPDTNLVLPPTFTPPPSTGPAPTPVLLPGPMPMPMPVPVPIPIPDMVPAPVLPRVPGLPPGGQQSGGGASGEPGPPGYGPLLPKPGADIEAFIPKPELTPSPGPGPGAAQPETRANVPEPGGIWLAGAGVAALFAARRRRPHPAKRA